MEQPKGRDWQKAEERKPPARGLALPPLTDEDKKNKGEKKQPVASVRSKKPPLPLGTSSPREENSSTQRKLRLKKAELAKNLEEIEIITNLTNVKRNTMEELKQRGAHLAETNGRLLRDIERTDQSTARQARALLLQYEVLQRMNETVRAFNQNRLETARAELQEVENTMEKNLGKLQHRLGEVTSKVQVLQDELGVLRTCRDRQCPEQATQIALLQDNIRNLKEQRQVLRPPCSIAREEGTRGLPGPMLLLFPCAASCCSQEERDKLEEMGKAILEELEEKARAEQEALLQKVVEETLLHQDGLKQMVRSNHLLQCEILMQKEIIEDLEEEIGELRRSIQTLRQSATDPRELIFADVLLHRPKCTPDTEVVLSIPPQGDTTHLTLSQAPAQHSQARGSVGSDWGRCWGGLVPAPVWANRGDQTQPAPFSPTPDEPPAVLPITGSWDDTVTSGKQHPEVPAKQSRTMHRHRHRHRHRAPGRTSPDSARPFLGEAATARCSRVGVRGRGEHGRGDQGTGRTLTWGYRDTGSPAGTWGTG
ncbi:LOW QUALITY PROTEIN: uncharacterized protein C20orf96 homolog [Aegotheles albertisi]